MSRESDVAAILAGDATLLATLTGGVFVYGSVGPEGISRSGTPTAFDAAGFLKPTALVKQRGEVPTLDVLDYNDQSTSARQVVEIWLYQDRTYAAIDTAKARIYTLLQGRVLSDSFELRLVFTLDRARDPGALSGASMVRVDYQVDFVME